MGSFADFKCECGYAACGRWGGGMARKYREQNINLAPALCKDCKELLNINVNDEPPKCCVCNGLNVIPYSDPSLAQVRIKSVVKSRPVQRYTASDEHPEPVEDVGPDNSDEDDDGVDIDDLLDLMDEEIEEEDYICGVETTYYLCPKCNRFTLEKSCCGLFD